MIILKNRIIFTLNPSQSRRLIAKGIVALPEIQHALEDGKIFVSRGSTNAYVLEELYALKNIQENFNKGDYNAGQIVPRENTMSLWVNKGERKQEVMFSKGEKIDVEDHVKTIEKFNQNDIFIKGANALDIKGVPAVLAAGRGGGTIGRAQGTLQAKGIEVICPIGLEKMILGNVLELQQLMGVNNLDKPAQGLPCGLIPMPFASTFTEIDAFETLFECEAYHVASGGVGGAEGSVSILVDVFDDAEMKAVNQLMDKIMQEPVYKPNLD
ncbi:hypothetical protein NEF87_002545 [Candidatus Lokiarchaeum ossiferum]|uniref:Uncharacterized protein n=1 Tax=Candidatus Lokiarchaeum ossiferum TaxID=2951803 RepID=A0ABY6HRX1_9ARCH|nr:hypothetical protein NEF87_002545 [Candidatus Lokiarchaeum sp. B-35]